MLYFPQAQLILKNRSKPVKMSNSEPSHRWVLARNGFGFVMLHACLRSICCTMDIGSCCEFLICPFGANSTRHRSWESVLKGVTDEPPTWKDISIDRPAHCRRRCCRRKTFKFRPCQILINALICANYKFSPTHREPSCQPPPRTGSTSFS